MHVSSYYVRKCKDRLLIILINLYTQAFLTFSYILDFPDIRAALLGYMRIYI